VEDLIGIGAYVKGSNPQVDLAVSRLGSIQSFLKQGRSEDAAWNDTTQKLKAFLN
jgi:flagellum-specific ATP synthase